MGGSKLTVSFLILVCITGCTNVTVRPGVTSVDGYYERIVPATPANVAVAAKKVLVDMQLMLIPTDSDAEGTVHVEARNSQDTRIKVEAVPDVGNATKVRVAVEPGNSEALSLQVLDRIDTALEK